MTPLFLANRNVHWTALGLLLAAGVALCLWISSQRVAAPELGDYHLYRCETRAEAGTGSADGDVFSTLLVSSSHAREIADRLCAAPAIRRHYGAVQVSWKPRGRLGAEEILSETYDLIWSRGHTMAGLVPEYGDYYEPLMRYDHYRVYWFSRGGAPELTAEYFHGKRIGLLNDKLSHTLYLLPLASLKEAGIEFSAENLVYFDDAVSLYQAFARDELDLVSGGDYVQQDLDIPLSRTLISSEANAATLFVRRKRAVGIDCALAAAFDGFANEYLQGQRAFEGAEHCVP
ncbi:substrate-binding domain-containing protein [Microbulbifer pacificus]|uniref:Solute-binding protein family 3/N-terminal domain-containing protein n=1 Tax=Microbulbifer pacificus TaxID=407164 RepID=A0AAU0MX58_9GAMM|nr:hypothetical protein [Microbulbifer pacificus]WOX04587.1 hypothetical protein R5R33_12650 [Microbulbifer pacificus]